MRICSVHLETLKIPMMMPSNARIFLCGLKLCRENRTKQVLLVSKKKTGVTMHFSEIIKLQFGKEHHTFHRTLKLFFFSNIVD